MKREERYEVCSDGRIVIGEPVTLSPEERKVMIERLFSINGWKYTLLQMISPAHFYIKLENKNLGVAKTFHLYHGSVRKEDPERNREEKKIQLGAGSDPRIHIEDSLILGFYAYENKGLLSDLVVVAWPIEKNKNYPANPSLRVNMRTNIQVAKNIGFYVDKVTGKNLIVFRPEFIYHYVENYKSLQYSETTKILEENNFKVMHGDNILLYGVPGVGKSWTVRHEYCDKDEYMERTVFHPDYTYSDFVGQILPKVEDGDVRYCFEPGPFTRILKKAIESPQEHFYLVIEEINRGNAAAIFGDVFQLLDRDETRWSDYGISNEIISNYIYDNENTKIKIPGNLSIIATMNTSDQNVFTLDTAFKRRWKMRMIENDIDGCEYANHKICGSNLTWGAFVKSINEKIVELGMNNLSNEDNRIGAYFVKEYELDDARLFGEKVLMYLWDDACKFERDKIFKAEYRTLDELLGAFDQERFDVFLDGILSGKETNTKEEKSVEPDEVTMQAAENDVEE